MSVAIGLLLGILLAVESSSAPPVPPPRYVYVPYRDLKAFLAPGQEGVMLSRPEFEDLWRRAWRRQPGFWTGDVPAKAHVVQADYEAWLEAGRLCGSARLLVERTVDTPAVLALSLSEVAVADVRLDDQPACFGLTGEGYVGVVLDQPGRHRLTFRWMSDMTEEMGARSALIELPVAPAGGLKVRLPEEIELESGATVLAAPSEAEVARADSPEAGRRLRTWEVLGVRGRLTLVLRQRTGERPAGTTLLMREYKTEVHVGGEGVTVRTEGVVEVLGAAVSRLRFQVPAELHVVLVSHPKLQRWESRPGSPGQELLADFAPALHGAETIRLEALGPAPRPGRPWPVPAIRVAEAQTLSGQTFLQVSRIWRAVCRTVGGARIAGLPDKPASSPDMQLHTIQHWGNHWQAFLDLYPVESRRRGRLGMTVRVQPEGTELAARVQLVDPDNPIYQARLRWPAGWEIETVQSESPSSAGPCTWSVISPEAPARFGQTTQPTPAASDGSASNAWLWVTPVCPVEPGVPWTWTIVGRREIPGDEPGVPPPMPLPALVPEEVTELDGYLALVAAEGFQVQGADLVGLAPARPDEWAGAWSPQLYDSLYRLVGADYSGWVIARPRPPVVTATSVGIVRLVGPQLRQRFVVDLEIARGRTRTLAFHLSGLVEPVVEVQAAGRSIPVLEKKPTPGSSGGQTWEVRLAEPVDGRVTLTVEVPPVGPPGAASPAVASEEEALSAASAPRTGRPASAPHGPTATASSPASGPAATQADDSSPPPAGLSVAVLSLPQAAQVSAYLLVESDGQTAVRLRPVGLQEVRLSRVPGAPAGLDARHVVAAYRAVEDTYGLSVAWSRHARQPTAAAVVLHHELTTVVDPVGLLRQEAQWRISAAGPTRLHIRLPSQSTVRQVRSPEKWSWHLSSDHDLVLELGPEPKPQRVHVQYETPVPTLGLWGTVDLPAPEVDLPVLRTRGRVLTAEGYAVAWRGGDVDWQGLPVPQGVVWRIWAWLLGERSLTAGQPDPPAARSGWDDEADRLPEGLVGVSCHRYSKSGAAARVWLQVVRLDWLQTGGLLLGAWVAAAGLWMGRRRRPWRLGWAALLVTVGAAMWVGPVWAVVFDYLTAGVLAMLGLWAVSASAAGRMAEEPSRPGRRGRRAWFTVRSWAILAAGLGVGLWPRSASGGPAADEPRPTAPEAVVIPYRPDRPFQLDQAAEVFLSAEQFGRLKQAATGQAPDGGGPTAYVITEADYRVRVRDDVAHWSARLAVEVFAPGLIPVPLGMSGVSLVSSSATGPAIEVHRGPEGLVLLAEGPGRRAVTLELVGPVEQSGRRRGVALEAPAVPTAVARFEPPPGDYRIRCPAAAGGAVRDDRGVVTAAIGRTAVARIAKVSFQWEPASESMEPAASVRCDQLTWISFGLVGADMTSQLTYQLGEQSASYLAIGLAPQVVVREVSGAAVRNWTIRAESQRPILHVNLARAAGPKVSVQVSACVLPEPGQEAIAVMLPKPLGARHWTGMVGIGSTPGVRVRLERRHDLGPTATARFAQAAEALAWPPVPPAADVLEIIGPDPRVQAVVRSGEPALDLDSLVAVRVEPRGLAIRARLTFRPEAEGVYVAEVDVPSDVRIDKAVGPPLTGWAMAPEGRLQLHFGSGMPNGATVWVDGRLSGWPGAATQPGPGAATAPRAAEKRSPATAERRTATLSGFTLSSPGASRGRVLVYGPSPLPADAYRVQGLTPLGLAPLDPADRLVEDGEPLQAYQFRQGRWRLAVRLDRLRPVVEATCATTLTVEEDGVDYRCLVLVQVSRGTVDRLRVRVPSSLGPSVHVEGEGLAEERLVPGARGQVLEIRLARPVPDRFRFALGRRLPLPAQGRLSIPEIGLMDVKSVAHYLAVVPRSDTAVHLEVGPGALAVAHSAAQELVKREPLDKMLGPYLFQHGPMAATLTVQTRPGPEGAVPGAVADLADIVTVLETGGTCRTWARYSLRHVHGQFVRLVLPAGSDLLAAAVDGRPVVPVRPARAEATTLLLPLGWQGPASGSGVPASARLDVVCQTRLPGPVPTLGSIRLESPRPVEVEIRRTNWTLYAPSDYSYRLAGRSLRPAGRHELALARLEAIQEESVEVGTRLRTSRGVAREELTRRLNELAGRFREAYDAMREPAPESTAGETTRGLRRAEALRQGYSLFLQDCGLVMPDRTPPPTTQPGGQGAWPAGAWLLGTATRPYPAADRSAGPTFPLPGLEGPPEPAGEALWFTAGTGVHELELIVVDRAIRRAAVQAAAVAVFWLGVPVVVGLVWHWRWWRAVGRGWPWLLLAVGVTMVLTLGPSLIGLSLVALGLVGWLWRWLAGRR